MAEVAKKDSIVVFFFTQTDTQQMVRNWKI